MFRIRFNQKRCWFAFPRFFVLLFLFRLFIFCWAPLNTTSAVQLWTFIAFLGQSARIVSGKPYPLDRKFIRKTALICMLLSVFWIADWMAATLLLHLNCAKFLQLITWMLLWFLLSCFARCRYLLLVHFARTLELHVIRDDSYTQT